jgi:hypothetical protein
MDRELSQFSNFQDFLEKDGLSDFFLIKKICSIDEIDEHLYNIPSVFFLGDDLILDIPDGDTHTFHICSQNFVDELEYYGDVIIRDRQHFSLYVYYTLFNPTLFNENKMRFANKLFYFLDSPVDPFILKEWGVELDLTAVSYNELRGN